MKKNLHGPSLYYATDKNVFDALNQHKVDAPTVARLFQRRNIIVCKKTAREDLALYFSRITHDYYDHRDIASRLGVASRRERITSMDVTGLDDTDELQSVADKLKAEMEAKGDVVQLVRDGENLSIRVQYSEIDYKRSEFTQVQVRDGVVEFEKTSDGYVVRNTQNDYLNGVRETLLAQVEKTNDTTLTKIRVSLFDVPTPKLRSKFFHELAFKLTGYTVGDVTDVFVFKAKPESNSEDDSATEPDTHVEKVFLRGSGVSRSEILNELLDEDNYYITKMSWTAKEIMGAGHFYEIEAAFVDPKDCSVFSFILSGVYDVEAGNVSSRRRQPLKSEIDTISRVIEGKARELIAVLRIEHTGSIPGAP